MDSEVAKEYGPAGRYRTFEVVILNDSTNVYRGFGMTLARVIAEESEHFSRRYKAWKEGGHNVAEFLADEPDRVVWTEPRAMAILRPMVGGTLAVIPVGDASEERCVDYSLEDRQPTDDDDRRELPRDIANRAIARWREAVAESAEAYRLARDHGGLESWTDLTTIASINANRVLIRAILAYDPGYATVRRHMAEKRRWKPRGIRSNGKLYITLPNPGRDEGQDGCPEDLDGPDLMELVVVDEANIVDIERAGYLDKVEVRAATVIGAESPAAVVEEAFS